MATRGASPQPTKPAKKSAGTSVYQLKVTLQGSKPPIWRRIQVPGAITLERLHDVLQVAMGWENYHLHQYFVGQTVYGEPEPEAAFLGFDMRDERRARLSQVAPSEGDKFVYQYDFGDGWDHTVLVEKILAPEAGATYPRCLTGRRACPPEDCGGIWGYYELLEVLNDPNHPGYAEMREWAGGDLDPAAFSVDDTNAALSHLP